MAYNSKEPYAKCVQCGEIKSSIHFHSNSARENGMQSNCKPCRKAFSKINQRRKQAENAEAAKLRELEIR